MVSVSRALTFHEPPDTLDEVEVRRVGREVEQLNAKGFVGIARCP